MGFQKGFKIYKTSVQAGNFVCCVLEGVSKKKEKKKMFLMVDSEIDMQMVDSENEWTGNSSSEESEENWEAEWNEKYWSPNSFSWISRYI